MQLTRRRDRDGPRPGSRRRECELRAALSARETRSGCRTEGRHGLRQREAVLSSVDSRGAKSLNLQLSLRLHCWWETPCSSPVVVVATSRRHVSFRMAQKPARSPASRWGGSAGEEEGGAASDMDGRCDVPWWWCRPREDAGELAMAQPSVCVALYALPSLPSFRCPIWNGASSFQSGRHAARPPFGFPINERAER